MRKLTANWLTEDHIDFEYKKYKVLAYLQEVEQYYKNTQVYPWLSEVLEHYRNLSLLKSNTENLKKGFPKELNRFDPEKLNLDYSEILQDDDLITEIRQIIDYSLPLFYNSIVDGKKIYDFVEEHLKIQSVGITPLNNKEGYLLLHTDTQKDVHVFQYAISSIEDASEKMKTLSTHYVQTYTSNLTWTYERVKTELIGSNKELPNPAVYAIECAVDVPFKETLFPVARRFFVMKIAA
jgi:hypothetical protein